MLTIASKHPDDNPKDPRQAQAILDHQLNQARENPRQAYQNALDYLQGRPEIRRLLDYPAIRNIDAQIFGEILNSPEFTTIISQPLPTITPTPPMTEEPDYSTKHIPEVLKKLRINLLPVEFKQHANQIIAKRRNTPAEANIIEYPIASYKKGSKLPTYITYKDGDITSEVGSMYGCLTGFDEQVLKEGLFSLAVPYRGYYVFYASLDQLRKRLGLSKGGTQYAQLRKSLKKLGAVHFYSSHFYHADDQDHDPFLQSPLFAHALFLDTDPNNPDILYIFAPPFSANLIRGYHVFLNDKYRRALPTYLTKRIYEYLYKKIGTQGSTHKENALHLCLKVSIDCKRQRDSLKALRHACQIISSQTDIIITIQGKTLIAERKPKTTESKASSLSETTQPQIENKPQETQRTVAADYPDTKRRSNLQIQLHNIGLEVLQISAIFKKYPIEYLERHWEWLPYRHPKNPAACYLKAVKNNYSMPAQYEKEQHQKRTERT